MGPVLFAIIILAALVIVLLVGILSRKPRSAEERPEALILEEAELVDALAPGLEGRARVLRRRGGSVRGGIAGKSLEVRVRGADDAQAYPRGARVRLIDWRAGVFLVEAADAEHVVH